MQLDQYEIKTTNGKTIFEFISEGPKGRILKGIEYSKMNFTDTKNMYNLAFGDKDSHSGEIDDLTITDNQDREKVLATVANTVLIFTKRRPRAQVFIRGSTPVRTRLYQMAINKYYDELSEIFEIKGYFDKKWLVFEKNTNFLAFLITRKKIK